MTDERVSMSLLGLYEKDSDVIKGLCRTCLCKTDDEYIYIDAIMSWNQRENCSAQKMIEQILNRELNNEQPQPQRICSKCVKKIQEISMFRNQCIESDNILNEFYKHMQNEVSQNDSKSEFDFDINEIMFPEPIYDKFLPAIDAEMLRLESNVLDQMKRDLYQTPEKNPPLNGHRTIARKQVQSPPKPPTKQAEVITTIPVEQRPRRKTKKPNYFHDVDMYVNKILREDIKASLKNLTKKLKKVKQEKIFELCEQCGLTFSNSNEYKKHIRSHQDKANQTFRFQCKFCSKGFNHKQTYNIHINSHTREIKFICDMCGKELATKNSLRIHFRYHLGIKNHICLKCGHRFVTPRELRDHIEKKHATVRAIACTHSDCSETFDSEYRLNLHLRVHDTNYAFKCDVCGVATVSKFRLSIHKKIHTGEMIRHCPICQKRLAHDNALRRHIKNVHGDRNKAPNGTVSKQKRTITLDGIILTTTP